MNNEFRVRTAWGTKITPVGQFVSHFNFYDEWRHTKVARLLYLKSKYHILGFRKGMDEKLYNQMAWKCAEILHEKHLKNKHEKE